MEEKLSPLFSLKEILSEDEATKMGRKDPEEEVEKFVSANTQELGKDKWLCPLSGKKFKVRRSSLSCLKSPQLKTRLHMYSVIIIDADVFFSSSLYVNSRAPSLYGSTS